VSSPAGLRWQPSVRGRWSASGRSRGGGPSARATAAGAASANSAAATASLSLLTSSSTVAPLTRYVRRMARWLTVALLLFPALGVAACGGSKERSDTGERAAEKDRGGGEEAERERLRSKINPADRTAFYQEATVSGLVREQAANQRRETKYPAPLDPARLDAASKRLHSLRPRDTLLRALRARLLAAVADLRAAAGADKGVRERAAAKALVETAAVNRGLDRYTRRVPATTGLVPD